ncbi:MAG: fused response regulator/thioredoxin-disulfide reductase [Acidobacteria bacterium]|nr:MAG: fused response regulator/thioredoxin-disulfide reductase [Acidobacteriota bacterium]
MPKPVLLTVDDDPEVLRAIERDLRSRYADRYRVMRANSGGAAITTLRELKARNNPVALLLADQRMPQMDGVGFLSEAMELHPLAKRALLTAYADTSAAIDAINEARVHYYFMKPWDPPEEKLYPALDDLLHDWTCTFRPPYEGIRVLGTRWSNRSYELRDFLARNQVPYQWIDVELAESDPEVRGLVNSLGPEAQSLPLILFPDGARLAEPPLPAVADKIGLRTHAQTNFYDLAIVGGGPAGLAAAVYGASEGLRTVIIEREAPGGQAGLSSRIENYLGFPSGLTGSDLARRAVAQAKRFGVEILSPQEAVGIRTEGPYRYLKLADGSEISCHVLLLAMGVQWRTLDVPGIDGLQGAGVYYGGGTSEAISCKGETVYVIGGANSAGQAAMHFSKFAEKVVMLVRGNSLASTMSHYLIEQIAKTPNIEVWTQTSVVGVHGDARLSGITVLCSPSGETKQLPATSLFIFIGALPRTEWLGNVVERDERGFILSGPELIHDGQKPASWTLTRDPSLLETSVPGIFVVGDVRHGSVKRVASGVGEGAVVVQFMHQYLAKVQ